MRIERDERGDYVLDATALAEKLSIPTKDLRRCMRLGLVTSLVEAGEGEHTGLRRFTVRCGAEVWHAVVDADDQIIEEERVGEPAVSRLGRRATLLTSEVGYRLFGRRLDSRTSRSLSNSPPKPAQSP